jgi:hypothetical protein
MGALTPWRRDTSNPASKLSTTAAKPPRRSKGRTPARTSQQQGMAHSRGSFVVSGSRSSSAAKAHPKALSGSSSASSPSAASSYAMQWKSTTASVATCSTSATLARLESHVKERRRRSSTNDHSGARSRSARCRPGRAHMAEPKPCRRAVSVTDRLMGLRPL